MLHRLDFEARVLSPLGFFPPPPHELRRRKQRRVVPGMLLSPIHMGSVLQMRLLPVFLTPLFRTHALQRNFSQPPPYRPPTHVLLPGASHMEQMARCQPQQVHHRWGCVWMGSVNFGQRRPPPLRQASSSSFPGASHTINVPAFAPTPSPFETPADRVANGGGQAFLSEFLFFCPTACKLILDICNFSAIFRIFRIFTPIFSPCFAFPYFSA